MTFGLFSRRALLASGLAVSFGGRALADFKTPPPLSADDKATVDKAVAYLQNLSEAKGRFEQTDARGGVSHGELYLKRPGRARFAYDPPSGLLVISDGSSVLVSDPRLKTANRYPLGSTPLSLFLAKQVRLDKGVVVSAVSRFSDGFSLTAHDQHHASRGQITLVFGDNPMVLREWRMTDGNGRTTQIRVTGLEATSGLDPALFTVPSAAPVRGNAGSAF